MLRCGNLRQGCGDVSLTCIVTTILMLHLTLGNPTHSAGQLLPPVREDTCGIPQYHVIKGKLLESYDVFETMYRLSTFASASPYPKHNLSNDATRGFARNSSKCQDLQREANLNGGESCPSVRVVNRDRNRVPCVMEEVKCQCEGCILPSHLNISKMGCQPIYHHVPVMRGQDNGKVWGQYLEPIAVGCRCARRDGPKKRERKETNTMTNVKKPQNGRNPKRKEKNPEGKKSKEGKKSQKKKQIKPSPKGVARP